MKYVTKDFEEDGDDEVKSVFGPLIAIGVATYITADIVLAIFDYVVKALLVCLAIDMDMHDGEIRFGPETFDQKVQKVKGQTFKSSRQVNSAETNEMV